MLPPSGFPQENYMLSYWLAQVRSSPLIGLRTTTNLPAEVDYLIIGSGINGTALAYFLMTHPNFDKNASVLMLESREFCHGATGRNGGHCRPDSYLGFPSYKKQYGKEMAVKITDLEQHNLDLMEEVITKERIDCDFWRGQSTDVFLTEAAKKEGREAKDMYQAEGGNVFLEWFETAEESVKVTRHKRALAACNHPAASLFPFKLAAHLLQICLARGLNFQSKTLAKAVKEVDGVWKVETDRGSITAQKVIHCTNAYASMLIPELTSSIMPLRGHCSAHIPPKAYSGNNGFKATQVQIWGDEAAGDAAADFEYMVQNTGTGAIIIGGGCATDWKNNIDDATINREGADYLKQYMSKYYVDYTQENDDLYQVWTGIMGFTADFLPYVGKVLGRRNQYINAGHNGHGMARSISCSKGLAELILAGEDAPFSSSGLPEPFEMTEERISNKDWYKTMNHG